MKNKILKTFFGHKLRGVEKVIIIPIRPIYNLFKKRNIREYKGWWNNFYLKKNTLVVNAPIGAHIEDTVYYLPDIVKEVLLIGYCGSISRSINVGAVVSCIYASDGKDIIKSKSILPKSEKVRVLQVSSLSKQTPSFLLRSRKKYDCLDMETYTVFKICNKKGINASAFYIVTDDLEKPFFDVDKKDLNNIHVSSKKLVKKIENGKD